MRRSRSHAGRPRDWVGAGSCASRGSLSASSGFSGTIPFSGSMAGGLSRGEAGDSSDPAESQTATFQKVVSLLFAVLAPY